jgi:hypothetical protein
MTDPDDKPDLDAADSPDAIWAEMDAAEQPAAAEAAGTEAAEAEAWAEGDERPAEAGTAADTERAAPAEAPQADPWAAATPEQLTAWQAAQNAIKQHEQYRKSQEGRIAAFQRQIDELRRAQAAAPQGTTAAKAADQPQGAAAAQQEAALDAFASDGWKTLEEDYPEIAETVRAIVEPLAKEVAPFKSHLQTVQEDRRQQELLREHNALTERMPDWLTTIQESRGDFGRWAETQPRYIRDAVERNKDAIVDADEAADIIGRYKQHRMASQTTQPPASAGSPATQPVLPDRRARQLQSSASVQSKAPPVAVGIPDDPEGAWEAFERMGL